MAKDDASVLTPLVEPEGSHADRTISATLRILLKESGLSEAELARQTGIPQTTLNRILLGFTEDPRASTLKTLAKFFCITVGQLLGAEPLPEERIVGLYSPVRRDALTSIPLIEWNQIKSWLFERDKTTPYTRETWVVTERQLSSTSYALRSLPFMSPRFKPDSILIVDTEIDYSDGHFVIVALDGITPTVRRVMKEGDTIYLKSLQPDIPIAKLDPEKHKIYGTIVETRYNCYSNLDG